MTEASAPVLVARGLDKTYEADLAPIRALRGLDLDVAAGEFLAVMGPPVAASRRC